jgi:hypothetical protein
MPNLKISRAQAAVLAHALNSCRLSNFSQQQQEQLPDIGRKLSAFLADNPPKSAKKKLIGFAASRAKGSEMYKMYEDVLGSVRTRHGLSEE